MLHKKWGLRQGSLKKQRLADSSPFRTNAAEGFLLWKITALWQAKMGKVLSEFDVKGFKMADYNPAFEKMIVNEGGYVLHNVAGDRGGQTYAGIARNFHSNWEGWAIIDQGHMDNPELTQMVRNFYKSNFWDKVKGDDLNQQGVAAAIFDFAVNAGIKIASKLAQLVIGATPDGVIGPESVSMLNKVDEEHFIAKYALAKIARYAEICKRNPGQKKFLLGWVNRTLGGLS